MLKIPEKRGMVIFSSDTEEKYTYEAGFDVYTTGLCLISMHKRMSKLCGTTVTCVDAIQLFLNLLPKQTLSYEGSRYSNMNLGAADYVPWQRSRFHLEIPKKNGKLRI